MLQNKIQRKQYSNLKKVWKTERESTFFQQSAVSKYATASPIKKFDGITAALEKISYQNVQNGVLGIIENHAWTEIRLNPT